MSNVNATSPSCVSSTSVSQDCQRLRVFDHSDHTGHFHLPQLPGMMQLLLAFFDIRLNTNDFVKTFLSDWPAQAKLVQYVCFAILLCQIGLLDFLIYISVMVALCLCL